MQRRYERNRMSTCPGRQETVNTQSIEGIGMLDSTFMPERLRRICAYAAKETYRQRRADGLPKLIWEHIVTLSLMSDTFSVLAVMDRAFKLMVGSLVLGIIFCVISIILGWWYFIGAALSFAGAAWWRRKQHDAMQCMGSVLLGLEILATNFCGWGSAHPELKAKAIYLLSSSTRDSQTVWLDYYLPGRENVSDETKSRLAPETRSDVDVICSTAHATDECRTILPEGLYYCDKCGQVSGVTADGRKSTCLCEGILCSRCGQEHVRRPLTDYYDATEKRWLHIPSFATISLCQKCRKAESPREPVAETSSSSSINTEHKYMNTSVLAEIARNTPFRHETLPRALMAEIERIKQALDDVYPMSIQEWVDGFRKDMNPEKEVAWWLHVVTVFSAQAAGLSIEERKRIFREVIGTAMGQGKQEAPTKPLRQTGRAILAVVAGVIIGQISQVPLAYLLDFIYQSDVTAGRWAWNSANVILTCLVGGITGYSTGRIAKRRGKLLAAIAQFTPLCILVASELIKNVDMSGYSALRYDTDPALWVWIGLIPAVIGGHFGAIRGSLSHRG